MHRDSQQKKNTDCLLLNNINYIFIFLNNKKCKHETLCKQYSNSLLVFCHINTVTARVVKTIDFSSTWQLEVKAVISPRTQTLCWCVDFVGTIALHLHRNDRKDQSWLQRHPPISK